MPLTPGSNVSDTIRELHRGPTFKHTAQKFGKTDANRQAVAIALSNARKGRASGGVAGYDAGGGVNPVNAVIAALNAGSGAGGAPPAAIGSTPAANPAATPTTTTATPTNQVNSGLNPATGVAPAGTPTMGLQVQNTAPTASVATPSGVAPATGIAQPTTPAPGTTTPNNPIAKPLMAQGGALHRASGGFNMQKGPNLNPSWEEKQESRNMMHAGPVLSSVPGRTDRHNLMVPSSSYVVPADVVSGRGQGNTLAGANFFQQAFHMGPYGSGASMGIKHGMGAPRPPKPMGMMHSGGGKGGDNKIGTPVQVVVAGGEVIIPPDKLMEGLHGLLGYMPKDIKHAHRLMDAWMIHERKNLRKTLAKLPGPAKD